MCFNVQVSLLAWVISVAISCYLIHRNRNYDRWNAAFILSFSSIQLLEAGLWVTTDPETNSSLTKLILLVLVSQPLVQCSFGYLYTKAPLLLWMAMLFGFIFLWALYRVLTAQPGQFKTEVGPNRHLMWTDSSKGSLLGNSFITTLYLLGLFVPLFFMKNSKGLPLIIVAFLTVAASLYFAPGREFGSFWCFSAIAYSIVALFI